MGALLAVLCSGAFFGAALCITWVQHPAALQLGPTFAARLFPPMYRRAAPMQVALAVTGTAAGIQSGSGGGGALWWIGAALLFSVVPLTLIVIKPVNDALLASDRDPDAPDGEALLRRWGALHAWRTLASGLAFLVFVIALASR